MSRTSVAVVVVMLCASGVVAEVTIPEKQRVNAAVTRTIEASPDNPMKMPTDAAVDALGNVFVADGVNHRVVKFNADGKQIETYRELDKGKLVNPVGLHLDSKGRLWIADSGAACVWMIDDAAATQDCIAVPELEAGKPADVTDVAVTRDGERVYLVDNDNHRVLTCELGKDTWQAFGRRGRAVGEFEWPFQLALSADDEALIVDTLGSRIQRITKEGRWTRPIGRWGVEVGCLYRPKGVACDAAGLIYVSDSTLGVVQVFQPTGRLNGVLCDDAGSPLRFAHPMGMCFDAQGRLYVVELQANRVAVVEIKKQEETPAKDAKPAEEKAE